MKTRKNRKDGFEIVCLLFACVYILIIGYITCGTRPVLLSYQIAPYPLWSIVEVLTGDYSIGIQIIENILLFFPLGLFLYWGGFKVQSTVLLGLILSIIVELSQFYFHVGLTEIDDILSNTVGTLIGAVLCKFIDIKNLWKILVTSIIIIGSIAFCFSLEKTDGSQNAKDFFFEVENVSYNGDEIRLNGYCFSYEEPEKEYKLYLAEGKERIPLSHTAKEHSKEIDAYFKCDKDYSNCGFSGRAVGISCNSIYEIIVCWDNRIYISTRTFIVNGKIAYTQSDTPDFIGIPLVAKPEYSFYVFQYENYLYWLLGQNVPFNIDEDTIIQYQLWTTQVKKLPEARLNNNLEWDNRSFKFEEYEVGSFGSYRVAKIEIPMQYSVKAIVTGDYRNRKWNWNNYFRPVLFELPCFNVCNEDVGLID